MKFAICLALCLFVTSFAQLTPNEQALQNLYNGFFEKAGLADPTTILSCYDDSSATLTINFIGTVLQQLDNYDVFDVQTTVTNFQNALPQSVKDCTNSNAEYQSAQAAYHLTGLTMSQITSKVAGYAFTHLAGLHTQAAAADKDFKAGNYNNVGQEGGALAQSIFGSSLVGDDQVNLQLMANGYWENAGLADPTTLSTCFDANTASLTVAFIGQLLSALASSNIQQAESLLDTFQAQFPAATQTCLAANAEMQQMLQAYNMYGQTIPQIEDKVESYALFHLVQLHTDSTKANNDFIAGNYQAVGLDGGAMIRNVYGTNTSSVAVGDDQVNLQLMANGYWENAGLADPTTLSTCFDANTASLTVAFIGQLLSALASSNIQQAESLLDTFQAQFPAATQACLAANAEMQQMLQAYNMYGQTIPQIEDKVESYALFHLVQLHTDSTKANNDFIAGSYQAVGLDGGAMIRNVYGTNTSAIAEPIGDDLSDLQQMADGFWENAGLSDPTTFITCFDANSANITVTFFGNVLSALANSNVKAAEAALETFETTLPNSTKTCLNSDAETVQVLEAYNIYGLSVQQLESKVESYAVWHLLQLHKDAVIANNDFTAGNYKDVGQEGGVILRSVFGKNNSAEALPRFDFLSYKLLNN